MTRGLRLVVGEKNFGASLGTPKLAPNVSPTTNHQPQPRFIPCRLPPQLIPAGRDLELIVAVSGERCVVAALREWSLFAIADHVDARGIDAVIGQVALGHGG